MTRIRWTIKRKLLTLGTGAFVLALALLAFAVWSEIKERSRIELDRLSDEVANRIAGTIDVIRTTLLAVAKVQGVQDLDRGETEQLILDLLPTVPFVEGIGVFKADGQLLSVGFGRPSEVRKPERQPTVADRPWFQQLMRSGEPVVSGLLKGRLTGQPVVLVAVPIRKGENRPHATMGASLNLSRWFAFFSGLSVPPDLRLAVVDADGIVLAQNWDQRSVGKRLGPVFERPGLVEWDGQRFLLETASVRGVDWRVLAMLPQATLYARASHEIRAVVFPVLAILGLAAIVGLLIARGVWRPLQALTHGVQEFGEGRRTPLRVDTTDEVGELARAFNEMAERLDRASALQARKTKDLEALIESGRLLTATLGVREVLSRLAETARSFLNVDVVRIWLLDEAAGTLSLAAHVGVTGGEVVHERRLNIGEGIVGWTVEARVPRVIPDVRMEPRVKDRDWIEAEGIVSFLGVPLRLEGQPLGAIAFFTRAPRDFAAEEIEIAEAFGNQAAIAIRNARLLDAREGQVVELSALQKVSQAITSSLNLPAVLEAIAESAIALIGAQRCAVFELDPEGQRLHARATRGMRPDQPFMPMKLGQGAAGSAALLGKPVFSPDVESQPLPRYDDVWEEAGMTLWEVVRQRGYRAILAVPLVSKEAVLGAICIYWDEVHSPEEQEIRLLTALAQQAAIAVDNARLFEGIQRQSSRLQGLYEIGKLISSTLNLPQLLQQIADRAAEVIGSSRCAVWELNEADQKLYPRATKGIPPEHSLPAIKVGQGSVGKAAATRQPAFSPDVFADSPPGYDEIVEEHSVPLKELVKRWGYRSILAVPLIAREQVVGVINILWDDPHPFAKEEVEALAAFASQAALAIVNARLYDETLRDQAILEHSHRTLEAIHQLSVTMQESVSLRKRLDQILRGAQELLGLERIGIYLPDSDESHLTVVAARDPLSPVGEVSVPTTSEGGVLAKVFREGCEFWLASDQQLPPELCLRPPYSEIHFLRTKSFGALALKARGRVVGVLAVDNKVTARPISRETVPPLRIFAQQAAVAIENARLLENLQKTLEELKVAQEQLVRGETLRSLGEMAAGAAHHLNNLLAVVLARVQLLLGTIQDSRLRQPLRIVERAALDGAEVVRRIQQFARIRSGEEPVPVDLNQIAEEALEFTRPRWQNEAQARGVMIDARLVPGQIPSVSGHAAELREVVTNLVLNAVDAMPQGGKIALTSWLKNGAVFLSVSDTGIGMSKEVKRRALEPFFTTKGVKSTGLGLSVAYGVIQRHGGTLTLESEEGRGTTATLRFPAVESRTKTDQRAPAVELPARPGRLLVIDDEPAVLEVLREFLGILGHSVTVASNGADGLALLERERYDLVLTDLAMPEMTGWQVVQAAKARWPGMPVILLTGWADQIDPSDGSRVDRILRKPFRLEEVGETLARLLPPNSPKKYPSSK